MRIALIGFGYWGEKLVKSLLSFTNIVNYLCVVDIDKTKGQKAKKYKLDFYPSLEQVYDNVEAFIIATWENTHYEITKKCLLKGRDVLVEKPLSLKYKQAEELVKIAQQKKLILMVDNTFLFDKSFLFLKKEISKGRIGKLRRIDSFRFSPNIIKPFTNVIIDLFPHDISIFYSLLKSQPMEIEVDCDTLVNTELIFKKRTKNTSEVAEWTPRRWRDYYDNTQIRLNFGPVITNSFLSWTYPVSRREVVFYGSKGIFLWQKVSNDKDRIRYFRYDKDKKMRSVERLEIGQKSDTLKKVLSEFLQSILNKKEPKTSGRKVLPEVRILEKVLKTSSPTT